MSVSRYWREIPERTRLEGQKCASCGNVNYPPRARCLKCGSSALEPYKLPDKGSLISFTVIRNPPSGFERYAPYVLGLVELKDGTRITAQITDVELNDLKIGMPVESVFRKISEDGDAGIICYAIKFRPLFSNP